MTIRSFRITHKKRVFAISENYDYYREVTVQVHLKNEDGSFIRNGEWIQPKDIYDALPESDQFEDKVITFPTLKAARVWLYTAGVRRRVY